MVVKMADWVMMSQYALTKGPGPVGVCLCSCVQMEAWCLPVCVWRTPKDPDHYVIYLKNVLCLPPSSPQWREGAVLLPGSNSSLEPARGIQSHTSGLRLASENDDRSLKVWRLEIAHLRPGDDFTPTFARLHETRGAGVRRAHLLGEQGELLQYRGGPRGGGRGCRAAERRRE